MICRFLIVKSLWIPYLVETFLWYDIYIFNIYYCLAYFLLKIVLKFELHGGVLGLVLRE